MNLFTLQVILETFTFLILAITTTVFALQLRLKNNWLNSLGFSGMVASNISVFVLLLTRWVGAGYFPISNLYESLFFLIWALSTTWLVLWVNNIKIQLLNLIINILLTLLCGFLHFVLPNEMREVVPLVPALKSNWLMMHVSVMMISYATLITGSLFCLIYLYLFYRINFIFKERNINFQLNLQNSLYNVNYNNFVDVLSNTESTSILKYLDFLKLAKRVDNISYRLISFGFPLLTIGIIAGAVWANQAWGSYWSWDPKETWALITWLVFATYLHIRIIKGWKGEQSAIVGSIGFFVIWICYLGVNFLGKGIHSYGWFF